ncbi:MAG: hypothetical protein Q4A32_02280 [Lachnospiraceae bacterium]|nr:hypothetical protein [Lachnospiraceae bacterium]
MVTASKICRKIISALGTALLLSLVFLNFFMRAYMPLTKKEHMEFYRVESLFMVLAGSFILLFIIILRKNLLRHLPPQTVSAVSAIFYLISGLVLIFHAGTTVRSDVLECFLAAQGFHKGDFSSLKEGGYLFENAHQIGFILFETLLVRISQNARVLFFLNLILAIVDNLLIVRLASITTGGNREAVTIAGLLAMLFLPHLHFILFGYNQQISMTLMLAAAVCMGKFIRTHSILPLFFMGVFSFLSVCVRGNSGIFVMAEILLILLHMMRGTGRKASKKSAAYDEWNAPTYGRDGSDRSSARRNLLCLAAAIVLAAALLCAGPAMRAAGRNAAGQEIPKELPKTMWVAMGMQDGPRAAGWYNGYIYRAYRKNGYDLALAAADSRKEIHDRIQVFHGDLGLFVYFYSEKIYSTWCEPTFESIWSGPLEDMDQQMGGRLLHQLYAGGVLYAMFVNYCSIINLIIFAGAFVGMFLLLVNVVRRRGAKSLSPAGLDMLLFPCILLLGGFLFHIFWETKSQYVMIYVYMLIPLSAFGYACVCPETFRKAKNLFHKAAADGKDPSLRSG